MAELSEVSEDILSECRRLIGGDWYSPSLPLHLLPAVQIEPITQGQTNKLYILSLKPNTATNSQSLSAPPFSVILRLFADIWTREEILTQNIVYAVLSERGLAPKLYGVLYHPQGRLEHFYPCRTLLSAELYQPDVLSQTTRLLANMHRQCMPVDKEPSFVFKCMRRWLKQSGDISLSDAWRQDMLNGMLCERNWEEEIDWLEKHLKHLSYPIVFCHNDFSQANLLLLADRSDSIIKAIDFEFSSYNYRGFDLAQHFKESAFDFTVTEHPFYSYKETHYPSYKVRSQFVKLYLESLKGESTPHEVDSVIEEVEALDILIDIWGYFWALSMVNSSGTFGYLEFAQTRLSMYETGKAKLLS